MAWIEAVWQPQAPPGRILVAGCGTGAEAFALRHRFPNADIVGVDFSARSLAVAEAWQRRRRRLRPVRFIEADLQASSGLPRSVGRGFDLVSCHGVLTYLPHPERGLANLARCLSPDGALYLGVNGSSHRSVALRAALPHFGFVMDRFEDRPWLRQVLELYDAIVEPLDRTARESVPYLASDVFGAIFHNLPLARWASMAQAAGLWLGASYSSYRDLRRAVTMGLSPRLVPRSRAEVSALLDLLQPAAFHRLVFTKRPAVNPPWSQPDRLIDWRLVPTRLFTAARPKTRSTRVRTIRFRSPATNTLVEYRMTPWQQELLRRGDGRRSLRSLLRGWGREIPPDELVAHLYVLYQLLIIHLQPPSTQAARS